MTEEDLKKMNAMANDANTLTIHTVYFNPADHPGKYVVRDHYVMSDGRQGRCSIPRTVSESIELARGSIPFGKIRMSRDEKDDPVIVETWI